MNKMKDFTSESVARNRSNETQSGIVSYHIFHLDRHTKIKLFKANFGRGLLEIPVRQDLLPSQHHSDLREFKDRRTRIS